ncbi:4-hydroxy-tetrahydrodipicolinate reductase [Salinarimonas sp. NSM]|uniref:4-hydroxy-tetrahydrodipicolinate reductase n=1 Tax=Salinarimonas sp. NSM TaxID=3458003 RepID=UPI00403584F1
MSDMRLAVVGASGRMGRTLVRTIVETPGCALSGAFERPGADGFGADAGVLAGLPALGVTVGDDPERALEGAEAVIDFTAPAATTALAGLCAARGIAHVVGTTGLSAEDLDALRAAAARCCVVQSGNMSLGVNLLASLVRRATRALGPEFDVEIVEMHHRHKVDAPSGTALLLGAAAAEGRGVSLDEKAVRSRDGHVGPRREGDIGFATLRGGSVVGEHAVILAGSGERIELRHVAEDRGLFARGAVQAALWARGRPPGFHSMADVLGLD